ncbi:hypothetical protein LJC63_12370 [Ruminococcaceae bacterium OttesenSCG-928-L11]|nr:hypothetical protein [Ruminococcaceae bacterium OttesenSCG-928-L11]
MKFKMRVLHFSPKGNAELIANAIAREQKCNSDKIPPAYPCENEKLLFIGVEAKGSAPDKSVDAFVKDLNDSRTKNIAFYIVGGHDKYVNELKDYATGRGIKVVGVHHVDVKGGLFSKPKVTDEQVKATVDWANKIVDSL